jgi:Tol biopolymer transport system component
MTRRSTVALLLLAAAWSGAPLRSAAGSFELISRTSLAAPTAPNAAPVGMPDASADGRYVVFASPASNLIEADPSFNQKILLVDAQSGTTELISVDSSEVPGIGDSHNPQISGDARYVLFFSTANNLDASKPGGPGLYLRDRQSGTTRRVDLDAAGSVLSAVIGAMSRDGRYLALVRPSDGMVYRKDLQPLDGTGALEQVSVISDSPEVPIPYSTTPGMFSPDQGLAISDDGSVVAWVTAADVPAYGGVGAGGDNDGALDVYLRDMGDTDPDTMVVLASRASDGSNAAQPACVAAVSYECGFALNSAGGVAFNLNTRWLSGNGQRVAFNTPAALMPGDTPRGGSLQMDAYLFDRLAGPAVLVLLTDAADLHPTNRDQNAPVVTALASDGSRALINFRNVAIGPFGAYLGEVAVKPVAGGALLPVARSADDSPACCGARDATLSADGAFAVFVTPAHATVDDLHSENQDVIRSAVDSANQTLLTRPASGANLRAAADNGSTAHQARVSADGRYVLFSSHANNLVAGDDDGRGDFFVLDRDTDTMQRVGTARPLNSGDECRIAADMTPDARYVVYTDCRDEAGIGFSAFFAIYRWDRQTDTRILVSRGDGVAGALPDNTSYESSISADGNRVAFSSFANNLDPAAPAAATSRIFLRDINAGTTRRLSRRESGAESTLESFKPFISADGRYVAFGTRDPLLNVDADAASDVYRIDTQDDSVSLVSLTSNGSGFDGPAHLKAFAADGRSALFVVEDCQGTCTYPGYVRDLVAGTTVRADLRSNGAPLADFIDSSDRSADGRFAVFAADVDDFISGESPTSQLIYVRDLILGVTARAMVRSDGVPAFGAAYSPRLSPDGRWIVFHYFGTDLVADPGNGPMADVFLTENPLFGGEVVADVDTITPAATEPSLESRVSGDGRFVVFESLDPKLHAACADVPNPAPLCGLGGDACPAIGPLYVFRLDTTQGCVDLVSVNEDETPIKMLGRAKGGTDPVRGKPSISGNGLLAVFVADAAVTGKLLGESSARREKRQKQGGHIVVLRNLLAGTSQQVSVAAGTGDGARPRVSASGNAVVFAAPGNAERQVFLTEVKPTGLETRCVSCKQRSANGAETTIDTDGPAQNPVVSADGRWVAYETRAKNLLTSAPACDNGVGNAVVVLRNMLSGSLQVMSQPRGTTCQPGSAVKPDMDYSGGKLVFQSSQPLTPGAPSRDETYFVDLGTNTLSQLSVDSLGVQVDEASNEPSISGDGKLIAFTSRALGYALTDTAGEAQVRNVVVRDLRRNLVRRLSRNLNGVAANGDSRRPSLSYTGDVISFDSQASNLSAADSNGTTDDVFLRINPLTNEIVFGAGFE